MQNLFNFEYQETTLLNQDGTESNFRQVFGLDGVNIACPKGSYHIVKTNDVSQLGHAFIEKGYEVTTFNHRNGEKIGLNVSFGNKPTNVGECKYNLIITVPNNGSGKGYLSIKQLRLVCSNGMMTNKTIYKDNYIKIPHTWNYKDSIDLMKQSIDSFTSLLNQLEERDTFLAGKPLTDVEVMYELNKWFYEQEMPTSHKKDMSFNQFRELLVVAPEDIKSIERYNELKSALKRELGYNEELNLQLSMYTVYASVTNYLSRRIEKSGSTASNEIQTERASKKLEYFEAIK